MRTIEIRDEQLADFVEKLKTSFESLIIKRLDESPAPATTGAPSTDPEHGKIFDPDHGTIFDPDHGTIFDPRDAFNAEDGVVISHASGSLYDSYGNRINKLESMDNLIELISWLLKKDDYDMGGNSETETEEETGTAAD